MVSGWTLPRRYDGDSSKLDAVGFLTPGIGRDRQRNAGRLNWSPDGKFIYLKDLAGKGSVERFHVPDGKGDRIVDLRDFVLTGLGGAQSL